MKWVAVLICCSTAACHSQRTVNPLNPAPDMRGSLQLTAEARATHARRLGGVVSEVRGLISAQGADSISIKADEVRFSDIGTAQFGGGELRFARTEISRMTTEVLDKRRSVIIGAIAVAGVAIVGTIFSPGDGFLGIGRTARPTAR